MTAYCRHWIFTSAPFGGAIGKNAMPSLLPSAAPQPHDSRPMLLFLCKHRRLIASVFLLIVVGVGLASFLVAPVYESKAQLLVERRAETEKAVLFRINPLVGYESFDWIDSEIELIKSPPIAGRVIAALGLDHFEAAAKTGAQDEEQLRFERAVLRFMKTLRVDRVKSSNVIAIAYEAEDATLVAAVVRNVIDTYIAYRAEVYSESQALIFFDDQTRAADEQLQQLEQRQAEFKQGGGVLSPEAQSTILLNRLSDYEKKLTEVRTQRINKEARLRIINEELQKGSDIGIPTTETSDSPSREKHIAKLKGELLEMELQKQRLLQKFTPQYEEVIALEQQIKATQAQIAHEVKQIVVEEEAGLRALQAEETVLQAAIAQTSQEIAQFAQKEYQFAQINRGLEERRELYSMLLRQREEARLSAAKLEKDVRIKVFSPAVVPRKPARPRKALNLALAAVLGLMAGAALAWFAEYFDHSINTAAELERVSGLALLGAVSEVKMRS